MKITVELERVFEILNSQLFSGVLNKPEFQIQAKKKFVFRFIPETYQIIVGGDFVKIDANALLVHLLHEMVHLSNFMQGIVDCRSNQYHNKEFMQAAVKAGLVCMRHRNQGWVTSLDVPASDEEVCVPDSDVIDRRVKAFNDAEFDKSVLRHAKSEFGDLGKRNRNSIYFLKYECKCPPPHNSIRSGRRPDGEHPPHIRCLDCKSVFTCVDI